MRFSLVFFSDNLLVRPVVFSVDKWEVIINEEGVVYASDEGKKTGGKWDSYVGDCSGGESDEDDQLEDERDESEWSEGGGS